MQFKAGSFRSRFHFILFRLFVTYSCPNWSAAPIAGLDRFLGPIDRIDCTSSDDLRGFVHDLRKQTRS